MKAVQKSFEKEIIAHQKVWKKVGNIPNQIMEKTN